MQIVVSRSFYIQVFFVDFVAFQIVFQDVNTCAVSLF